MSKAAERLAFGALTVWKYLGDQHPDYRTLAYCMRCNEDENTSRHEGEVRGEKRPRNKAQGNNITNGADEEQRASAKAVDEP